MSDKLKPCPFCGERATIYQLYGGYNYIRCINVECILNDDVEIFPQTWNTRPIEDELQHKLNKYQVLLTRIHDTIRTGWWSEQFADNLADEIEHTVI